MGYRLDQPIPPGYKDWWLHSLRPMTLVNLEDSPPMVIVRVLPSKKAALIVDASGTLRVVNGSVLRPIVEADAQAIQADEGYKPDVAPEDDWRRTFIERFLDVLSLVVQLIMTAIRAGRF